MKSLAFLCCVLLVSPGARSPAESPSGPEDLRRPDPSSYFRISVVDESTGRGVPLVQLRTTNEISYWTDSAGNVAFYEPGLMGRPVFFHVWSHGYEYPADGFGFRGRVLTPIPGETAVLKVRRVNVAERLYRVTGQGIYRDTWLLGLPVPLREPLLNGEVMGQDSVMSIVYRGKIYWFWGDTGRASYPLGHFGTSGATSELPGRGGLDPSVGIDLKYFVDPSGFSRPVCEVPGTGLKWMGGLMTVPDETGRERLIAKYSIHKSLSEILESGLAIFDDQREAFVLLKKFEEGVRLYPDGRPFRSKVGGTEYYYSSWPYPVPSVRVRADFGSIVDPAAYEAFTPLATGSAYEKGKSKVERGPDGKPLYRWRPATHALDHDRLRELIAAGELKEDEAPYRFLDIETGKPIRIGGDANWNEYRRRWILIGLEAGGSTSFLGEIWYAEGDTPLGPWVYARKIVTHDRYSFYWPGHHPFFDQDGGRTIYFQGTYTEAFSGNPVKTPRYDYNQILYRLRLDDPRLVLPVPVYRLRLPGGATRYALRDQVEALGAWDSVEEIPFFAIEPGRPREGAVQISARVEGGGMKLRVGAPAAGEEAFCLALPAEGKESESGSDALAPLYEHIPEAGGPPRYSVAETLPGHRRSREPLARVWRNPLSVLILDRGAKPVPVAASPIALEGAGLAVRFAPEASGMGVTSIENRLGPGEPERFLRAEPEAALIWRLVLRGPSGGGESVTIDNRVPCARRASLDAEAGRARLRWEGIDLAAGGAAAEKAALEVEVEVDLPPQGADSRWRIRVSNQSSKLGLWEIHFPLLGGFGRKGALDVAVPRGNWGTLERGAAGELSGTYPSHDWPMQVLLFGAGSRWLGLYVEDPRAQPRRFSLQPGGEFRLVLFPEDMGQPGKGFEGRPVALEAFEGSWWVGAKRYRRWAVGSPWCARGAIAARKDFPESLRRTALWWLASGSAAEVVPRMKEAAARFDVPLAVHWYNWHEIPFDVDYPEYFPTKPGFAEGARELAAAGIVAMPYINGRLWDVAGRNFPAAKPAACKQPGGEEVYIETYGSGAKLAPMCPATPLWQSRVQEIARRLFEECGVGAIYIDQIASAAPVLCHDPSHGHPLGGGSHWVEGYRKMLEPIRDLAASRGAFLTTENNAEPYMDTIDAFLVWLPRTDSEIPLVPAVYSGRTVYFSSPVRAGMEPDAFCMLQGRDFLWGCQLGWMGFELLAPERKEQAEYLLECARYRRALEKFLLEGELMGELELGEPPPPIEAEWGGWSGTHRARLPSVMTAVWRAPDGSYALLAANLSKEPRAISYRFDAGPDERVLVRVRPSGREALATVRGPFERREELGPREILALVLEPR